LKGINEIQPITPQTLLEMKRQHQPITAVVTYSYTMGLLAQEAGVDLILVGDSVARVVYGWSSHAPVTLDMMVYHTMGVTSACQRTCVMSDLPQKTLDQGLQASLQGAQRLVQEGHAAIVKIEGGAEFHLQVVAALAAAGIAVMAHFIPADIPELDDPTASPAVRLQAVVRKAVAFEKAGSCGTLLAKIPSPIAQAVTETLLTPTIGIGSGLACDGQILVLEDLLGLTRKAHPFYVKQFANLDQTVISSLQNYLEEVRHRTYPDKQHSRLE
jgi:3-methyl-2-oxobutanoate hydroxymethyltransferase